MTSAQEHTLPELPYDYNALEPAIDEQTMRIHHGKHHQGYVNKLNAGLAGKEDLLTRPIEELIKGLKSLPGDVQKAVRNAGGGHFNHSLFWPSLSPEGGEPSGTLLEAIEAKWGSIDGFKEAFSAAAGSVFGSGWAWLVWDGSSLEIAQSANQDNPLSDGKVPLLGLDVWEHAYYLKYQNKRPDYISAWWSIINWDEIGRRFEATQG